MRLAIDGTEKCSSSATVRIGDFLRFLTPIFYLSRRFCIVAAAGQACVARTHPSTAGKSQRSGATLQIRNVENCEGGKAQTFSFLVSKLSSISTLLGSRRKIWRRVLLGTSLTRYSIALPASRFFIASKPRLPKAT